ncbi:MAG: glutamate mutase L, partial [Candidatus Bathyarchaeia archaeon]
TTNVYSIYDGKFVRTVSANLGMSYSICNVLREAGVRNILQWIPFDIKEEELINTLSNKMIRPTTIPQTLEELIIEHAVAREALRLGFQHHKFLARGLRGVRPEITIADVFEQKVPLESYIDMFNVHVIGGTGGLLSHAPRRVQSAVILIDGFQPEGVTKLIQDSVFMMPHLGVLSTVYPEIALEIFMKDCLVMLGTCIAPRGIEEEGEEMLKVELKMPDGEVKTESLSFGQIKRVELQVGEVAEARITPSKKCDVGVGRGRTLTTKIEGGVAGIIIDARGRPITLPQDRMERKRTLVKWFTDLNMYPEKF